MQIHGFQKMTMLDFPGKVACTVFTAGCNFRCPFCHNASLVTHIEGPIYTEEEILAYLSRRRGLLDGVCVTGGEPLLSRDLESFLRAVRALGLAVKLDTNGSFPDRLTHLVEEGLIDYVAMDIKNSRRRYPETAGITPAAVAAVEDSVRFLLSGAVDYEFRTTVVEELHTEADLREIGEWIAGAKRYFLQQFVDSGDLIGDGLHPHSPTVMRNLAETVRPFVPSVECRGI